nr:hypothetical protein CFP56_74263 [Quercus suber]
MSFLGFLVVFLLNLLVVSSLEKGNVYIGHWVLLFHHHCHGCSSPTKSIGISAVIQFLPAADRDSLHIQ